MAHADCLNKAVGKTAFVMPLRGCHEWEREGEPLHNPDGPKTFANAIKSELNDNIAWHELDCHINDDAFVDAVLGIFDSWFPVNAEPV